MLNDLFIHFLCFCRYFPLLLNASQLDDSETETAVVENILELKIVTQY